MRFKLHQRVKREIPRARKFIKKEAPRARKIAQRVLSQKKTRKKPKKRSPTATTVTRKLTSRQLTELQNRGKTTIIVNGRKRIIKPSDVVNCTVRIR